MDYARFYSERSSRRQENLIRRFAEMRFANPEAISLAAGMPNPETFPVAAISIVYPDNIVKNLSGPELNAALQYGSSQGYAPLLTKYREFQKRIHNPPVKDVDVIFMPGSQEGFCKLVDLFLNDGEPIMVQTPTYTATLGAIRPMDPEFIGIPQDKDGVIPEEIEKICGDRVRLKKPLPKLLYVNPTGANPTGTVLTYERKVRIYELAKKYDFLIIEDDPYYFLHFMDKLPLSFLSIDTEGRVIRLDSFSKVISAGVRLGAVTARKEILDKLTMNVENSVLHASSLSQMLILQLFNAWSIERFEQHFREIQKFYREKRDLMLAGVEKHLSGIAQWSVPNAGMFLWVKVPCVENTLKLTLEKLAPMGVFVVPGNAFNWDSKERDENMRFSYSFASADDIEKALSIISKVIREEAQSKKLTSA
ncbi:kynurenine/alpha-aminoadipate aminotransferase, mitochondrial-like [Venturia canescens]|uniref:kynurenine/alpha-aminoadipate aminotransferase, mitochondrial-like n=1 Tax=Venturia canescens TaxID=32260 RepID=UPI001C9D5717|nr:kynurenine/alpha-aminoadipate aminotransferase, mitochondrial-like [Venturia canescens]